MPRCCRRAPARRRPPRRHRARRRRQGGAGQGEVRGVMTGRSGARREPRARNPGYLLRPQFSALDCGPAPEPAPGRREAPIRVARPGMTENYLSLLRRLRRVPQRVHLGERCLFRRLAARGKRGLDRRKAPLELDVGRPQHAFRVGAEMAGEVDDGEQEIADLRRALGRARRQSSSASISSASSRILASTARGSFQSKPTAPAFFCSFKARVRAGRATGTPASAPAFAASPRSRLLLRLDPLPQALDVLRRCALRRRRTHADGGGSACW